MITRTTVRLLSPLLLFRNSGYYKIISPKNNTFYWSNTVKSNLFSTTNNERLCSGDNSELVIDDDDDDARLISDEFYRNAFNDKYLLPRNGHNVIVIQPDIKWGPMKDGLTNKELKLEEACSLVKSLPRWSVVEGIAISVKNESGPYLIGKGNVELIATKLHANKTATAVFVSTNMLDVIQLTKLQKAFKCPVYDRYTLVLQIFKLRAQTREARFQVALAEIPYLKSRLQGMHRGTLDQQRGGMQHVGGSGETHMEVRLRLLKEREMKLKQSLLRIQNKRELNKQSRKQKQLPTVAVVGYTNSGKTSLIKALTQDSTVEPKDMLFATLDVTAHAGRLPSNMKVIYIDTVGFISNIPTDLVASFSATLKDMLDADVIVHVCDASHPDLLKQKHEVMKTLKSFSIGQKQEDAIIHVYNKIDLVEDTSSFIDQLCISSLKGHGLNKLANEIEKRIIDSTGRLEKTFKIPMSGDHLAWLYKESTVKHVNSLDNEPEYLKVKCVLTQSQYRKFQFIFGQRKGV